MQSLFAYEQCKEADYQLALEHIDAFFQPDLNSMQVQDKPLLKGQRTIALKQFENKFLGKTVKEGSDARVTQAIDEAYALNQKLTKKDFDFFRKNIVLEVEKINVFYLSALNLLPAFASIASHDKRSLPKIFHPILSSLPFTTIPI
ncbi:MAG: hypothetical protein WDN75_07240 [Bacteroidota bacterium]